jgi:hypothetical protein
VEGAIVLLVLAIVGTAGVVGFKKISKQSSVVKNAATSSTLTSEQTKPNGTTANVLNELTTYSDKEVSSISSDIQKEIDKATADINQAATIGDAYNANNLF